MKLANTRKLFQTQEKNNRNQDFCQHDRSRNLYQNKGIKIKMNAAEEKKERIWYTA